MHACTSAARPAISRPSPAMHCTLHVCDGNLSERPCSTPLPTIPVRRFFPDAYDSLMQCTLHSAHAVRSTDESRYSMHQAAATHDSAWATRPAQHLALMLPWEFLGTHPRSPSASPRAASDLPRLAESLDIADAQSNRSPVDRLRPPFVRLGYTGVHARSRRRDQSVRPCRAGKGRLTWWVTGVGMVPQFALTGPNETALPQSRKPLPFCERISLCGTLLGPVASATMLKRQRIRQRREHRSV